MLSGVLIMAVRSAWALRSSESAAASEGTWGARTSADRAYAARPQKRALGDRDSDLRAILRPLKTVRCVLCGTSSWSFAASFGASGGLCRDIPNIRSESQLDSSVSWLGVAQAAFKL